jgi:hypothetical protein
MLSTTRRWILGGSVAALVVTGGGVALAHPWAAPAPPVPVAEAAVPVPVVVPAPAPAVVPAPAPVQPPAPTSHRVAPKTAPKAAPKTAPKVAPKPHLTCDLGAPVKFAPDGNTIINRSCNYVGKDGKTHSRDPWIEGQLHPSKLPAKPKPIDPAAAALAACRAQTGWTTAQCRADAAAGNAS